MRYQLSLSKFLHLNREEPIKLKFNPFHLDHEEPIKKLPIKQLRKFFFRGQSLSDFHHIHEPVELSFISQNISLHSKYCLTQESQRELELEKIRHKSFRANTVPTSHTSDAKSTLFLRTT